MIDFFWKMARLVKTGLRTVSFFFLLMNLSSLSNWTLPFKNKRFREFSSGSIKPLGKESTIQGLKTVSFSFVTVSEVCLWFYYRGF